MKKLIILCFLGACGLVANAQFVQYHGINEMETIKNAPTETVNGYISTQKGWVRISLKVKESDSSILVVGYKEKDTSAYSGLFATYGNPSPWRQCSAWAEEVSAYFDGQEIANNFDCKVYISGLGTVYF